ncbi:MAG: helix-turn-helix domain-containing protein [Aquincola sp.]|nr:helix-turn-helix domain-containing protein [Aquincola sp.]
MARLARALGCSADYLSRRFHEERGVTLTAWITRERIYLAKDLLAARGARPSSSSRRSDSEPSAL